MNRLIICLTNYQLLNAINMRQNIFDKDDIVDIVLVDKTDFFDLHIRLDKSGIFSNVIYVEFDKVYKKFLDNICSMNNKFRELFLSLRVDMIFYNKTLNYLFGNHTFNSIYDEMYLANYSRIANMIYSKIYTKELQLYFYEDGVGNYVKKIDTYKYAKITPYTRFLDLFSVRSIKPNDIEATYIYEPEQNLVITPYVEIKLPKISKQNIDIDKINYIFGYESKVIFDKQYIVFEQAFDRYNVKTNEYEIMHNLINLLGEENLILKLHPRSNSNRFERFSKMKIYSDNMPWEVVLLNQEIEDKIFISINSTAVINNSIYTNENNKVAILSKLLIVDDDKFIDANVNKYFNNLQKNYPNYFHILENLDEIKKLFL